MSVRRREVSDSNVLVAVPKRRNRVPGQRESGEGAF